MTSPLLHIPKQGVYKYPRNRTKNGVRGFGASNYLEHTPSTALKNGTLKTFAWSMKMAAFGATQMIFCGGSASTEYEGIYVDSTDELVYANLVSSTITLLIRIPYEHKDPTAWDHCVLNFDLTNGAEVCNAWINGNQYTASFDTNSGTAATAKFAAQSTVTRIGIQSFNTNNHFQGSLSQVCFIDGAQLAQTSFGEWDADNTRAWEILPDATINQLVADQVPSNSFAQFYRDDTDLGLSGL